MFNRIHRYRTCRYSRNYFKRLVVRQLVAYLNTSGLLPRLQSAYRVGHSTETAVLRVLSDILLAIDMSAATSFCSDDWTRWNSAALVRNLPAWPTPVRQNRFFSSLHVIDRVRCPSRVGPRTHPYQLNCSC